MVKSIDSSWQDKLVKASAELANKDPLINKLVKRYGAANYTLTNHYYGSLVDSIISQQLSVHAARAIEQRLKDLFNLDSFPSAKQLLSINPDKLRVIGLSRQKISYILDLARQINEGQLDLEALALLPDDQVLQNLTKVKGIGVWTAQMFLIFSLGRLDVLPSSDLGIQRGVGLIYGLTSKASPSDVQRIALANNWAPHSSVASWYIWHNLGNNPAI